ncbi:predicted protein [Plenodomus lingam JN3]|uniref:Predicted protein n=1 Tax=Leptosphaeria maculans (strain JN3 / isolate v23.1.3 / race Av1-4-5-6-7-8) TaxID=985895 RepID=E4ZV50_LEPMJ|nr:predicted protein [Plenodomus lingam JN3]CBX95476.1 predicted protein [Plenodomus lingam JN3]
MDIHISAVGPDLFFNLFLGFFSQIQNLPSHTPCVRLYQILHVRVPFEASLRFFFSARDIEGM